MAGNKDLMVAWLNDAYAMENALIPILENHARDAEKHPRVRSRIEQHVEETKKHAETVEACLDRMGEMPSITKTTMGDIFGAMQAPATGPFQDEEVKNGLMDYATENFEIAAYRSLIAGAKEMGDEETARACEGILREEEEMAAFFDENLPTTVRDTLDSAA